ncbi:sodium channel subunit beta-2-like [Poeciliopsis prolifica]|uniref:sodium channel subunit beta-2-like n=1 Tax=Poeciliopsis prolifica TaxID=188132 RepID=UPI0024142A7B|nr:sodium channel subunit beta-2-like [Poeciliopsis prolifica]
MDSSHRTSLRFRRGAQLKVVCLFLVAVGFGPAIGVNINVTVGDNVTLPCEANDYRPLEVVEWSRPGTEMEYVLMFNNPDLEIPEQRFKGRVDLVDMEKGNVSLKLRNVKLEDRGTYECYVQGETKSNKRDMQPFNTVYLHVAPAAPPAAAPAAPPAAPPGGGHIGPVLKVVAVVAVLAPLVGFVWKKRNVSPPQDETVETLQA